MCYGDLVLQRENQQKLRQIGQELSNVDASANRLKSLEEELQRAVCIKLSNLLTHQLAHHFLIHSQVAFVCEITDHGVFQKSRQFHCYTVKTQCEQFAGEKGLMESKYSQLVCYQ